MVFRRTVTHRRLADFEGFCGRRTGPSNGRTGRSVNRRFFDSLRFRISRAAARVQDLDNSHDLPSRDDTLPTAFHETCQME